MYATVYEIYDMLSELPEDSVFQKGFSLAHSYRGSYDNLAVEPCEDTTVKSMLTCLSEAIGSTFTGYKGGDFKMNGSEELFLAYEGCCGSRIEGYKCTTDGFELVLNDNY
jgi:hypothetical protein